MRFPTGLMLFPQRPAHLWPAAAGIIVKNILLLVLLFVVFGTYLAFIMGPQLSRMRKEVRLD